MAMAASRADASTTAAAADGLDPERCTMPGRSNLRLVASRCATGDDDSEAMIQTRSSASASVWAIASTRRSSSRSNVVVIASSAGTWSTGSIGWRCRSLGRRSLVATSSRTCRWSSLKPTKPRATANRTTVGPLVPACSASSATVANAQPVGSSASIAASWCSAGVKAPRCREIRSSIVGPPEVVRGTVMRRI